VIETRLTGFRRFRRVRRNPALRDLVRETSLSPADFVYPLFVTHGRRRRTEIDSMPGQFQLSLDQLPAEAEALQKLRIPGVLLFGLPADKDPLGSEAFAPDGIIHTLAGTGVWGYSGDGGPATSAQLFAWGLALNGAGDIYVTAWANDVVRLLQSNAKP